MGSPPDEPGRWQDEEPLRRVDLNPFYLGPKPVTNREFRLFLRARPSETAPIYQDDPRFNHTSQPAVGVGWDQARRYATWAGLRLPTEAEWEYACRAGTPSERYGDLDAIAWYGGNSSGALHPVGTRDANPWGLFDMLGCVWEWVEDDHHPNYRGAPTNGAAWIDEPRGTRRLLRGGSWADNPRTVRAATRLTDHPGPRVGNIGFRLAADG
jgi:formylglycine-generating enzyme required for sulfatase activity